MATPELPEPMNSSPYHSKVKITTTLSDPTFVAGTFVSGKLDMECKADKGLGIGILMVELFAIQELSSRDHSATSTFLHSCRLFQGPGLPPSNAVQAQTMPGDPPLPQHYYQARRGKSTFLFRIPIPSSSPSSIAFASGLAKVRYELRASVAVYWKNENRLVVDNKTVDIVQAYPYENSLGGLPETIVVGDNGKLWMQGRMIGGPVVAGGSACLELQVKNHSNKKNSSLTLTLTRTLYLPAQQQRPATVQISDTLTIVPFRGPEYIIPPGAEGVANLVFDIPKHARGVQGGILDGESEGEEAGGQPRRTESLFEIRCKVEVKLGMGIGSKDIVLEIPIDVVHPMAIPQQPISGPYIQKQQLAPYTYANHAPVPGLTPYADHASYHPAYIDLTQIQPWLQAIEPPLLLHQGYPYGNATSSDPQLLPPFQPFYPIHESTGGHTPPPSHSSFLEAVPPPTLPYATSYQTPVLEPLRPVFIPQMAPQMDNFVGQIPVSNSSPSAMVHSPRPQLTPRHSFTRDPAFGSLTISKSERVEELEKMADEVAKRNRDLSGDLPGVAVAATGEHDEKINGDYSNFNKTLPGLPGKFGGRKKMGWDGDLISEAENHDRDVPQQTRDLMSVFPAAVHDHQTRDYHHPHEQPSTCGITYQTPPTPTLMAVLGPPKQALPLPLPPAPLPSATRMGKSPSDLLTSESGLDALERRLLAEVGTRKHLEPSDNSHHNNINTEESGEDSGRGRTKAALFKGHQLGRRDVRDVLSSSSSSPVVAGATAVSNGNQWLPRIDTDLDLEVAGSGGNGCGGNGSAPIPIPMKSPDPLNESAISSLILGSEGLASGLPGTGLGFSSAAAAVAAVNDSDGEGDGEADFDGRTHRAGSASLSGGSNSGSDRMALGSRGDGGGFHKHTRQRAEVSTPTNMIPQERNRSRRRGGGRGVEAKEKPKTSSSKKKQRLNDAGNDSNEPKKSRNKSSAAAKGRVTAWLGGIDPAVPPQEEIIPPSPSVIKDLDGLSFEDEQRAARRLLGSSPLVAAAPLSPNPDSASRTTPEGAIVSNTRTDVGANTEDENNNIDQDKAISAFPNPRSSGFIPITTLKRDTISLPSSNSVVRKPLLLSRDATVIEEARRVEDLWSLDQPDTTLLKLRGAASATSLLSDERIDRKPSPASSLSKPAGVMPLSYSAAVTSALPSAPGASSSAAAVPRKNADQTQSTSRPKGRPVPPSTTKPPGGKLLAFPPSKPPIDPEVKYDIRSARGGRGGKVSSVASLWASGAINNQRQTTAATATTSHSNEAKEVPKRLFNGGIEKTPDFLPSSSSALSKPVKAEKKLFSAAVMTPAPASKNVRAYMSTAIPGSGGGGSSGEPKKMASTSALPARSVGVFGGGKAGANRSSDNVAAMQKRSIPTAPASMNLIPGGKTTPTANLPTPSSSYGPPTGKLHELTKRGAGGTKGTGKPSINGPPGVIIKATSDPAVISSSHAVPTLSTTASLVIPHDQNSTSQKQDHPRHHLQPRGVVVKPSKSTTPGSGSRSVSPRPGSPAPPPEVGVVDNNSHSHSHAGNKPTELAFGQARLRHLIKKYQGSSPAGVGQKL